MAYESGYRSTAAERRTKEAERLAWLEARDRRWAAGTVDQMLVEMREVDCSPNADLRAFVQSRHAELVAQYQSGGAA
jgi:hypothetical protein